MEIEYPEHFSEEAKEVIGACLKLVADERPTATELKAFPFFAGVNFEKPDFPVDSLEEISLKSIREDFLARHKTTDLVDEEFEPYFTKFASMGPKLRHLRAKIKHTIDPPKPPGQIDEEQEEEQ
jgi:hypothetical protein